MVLLMKASEKVCDLGFVGVVWAVGDVFCSAYMEELPACSTTFNCPRRVDIWSKE